jgi:DNA-binding transcriptional MerR regulator
MARGSPRRKRPRRKTGEQALVKMSELARRSGVPGPTIKHYMREGLLPSATVKTSRNMAYYDPRLAERVRAIKTLQSEHFLPLKRIGELLEPAPSAALRSPRALQRQTMTSLAPAVTTPVSDHRRKRSEVIRTLGVTRAELDRLERVGVLDLRGEGDTAGYQGFDLQMLELLAEVRREGLGDVFPPEIADAYLASVRQLVAMEIEQFRLHALARPTPIPLPEIARQAVGFGERLIIALRAKLLPTMLASIAMRP